MFSGKACLWLHVALLVPEPSLVRHAVATPASVQIDAKTLSGIPA